MYEGDTTLTPAPANDSGLSPTGYKVLIRLKKPDDKIGSILKATQTADRDIMLANEGWIVAAGPVAWRDRRSGALFYGAPYAKVGDPVRIASFGQRIVLGRSTPAEAWYCLCDDEHVLGVLSREPMDASR